MSFILKNKKGLSAYGTPNNVAKDSDVASLASQSANPACEELARTLQRLPLSPDGAWRMCWLPASGWGNESHETQGDPGDALAAFEALPSIAAALAKAKPHLPAKIAKDMESFPSKATCQKLLEISVEQGGPEAFASEGEGWAVWMEAGQGWMDDKKRPGPLGAARMFESAAGCLRTAKAACFGSNHGRGPAAIVKIALEPIGFDPSSPIDSRVVDADPVRASIARREAKEIGEAIETGAAVCHDETSGCSFGWATWIFHPNSSNEKAGFVSHRNTLGPLCGAQLSNEPVRQWGASCLVNVRLRPTDIFERLGDAPAALVERDILLGLRSVMSAAIRRSEETPATARINSGSI